MKPWQGGGNMIDRVEFDHTTYAPPPHRFEAGTGHIAGAVGLRAALDYVNAVGRDAIADYEDWLTGYAMAALAAILGITQLGTMPGKIGVLAFLSDRARPEEIASQLDAAGIQVRAGHHCAQPTLRHFGAESAARPSLSLYNTREEVDALVSTLTSYLEQFETSVPGAAARGSAHSIDNIASFRGVSPPYEVKDVRRRADRPGPERPARGERAHERQDAEQDPGAHTLAAPATYAAAPSMAATSAAPISSMRRSAPPRTDTVRRRRHESARQSDDDQMTTKPV